MVEQTTTATTPTKAETVTEEQSLNNVSYG